MMRTAYRIAGGLAGLALLMIASAGAAAGLVPFLSSNDGAALLSPTEDKTPNVGPIATVFLQHEWILGLITVLIFLMIAVLSLRRGFDLPRRSNENTMREPWE